MKGWRERAADICAKRGIIASKMKSAPGPGPLDFYVSSATEDAWAGPRGEFAALELASPVWRLYGRPGLIAHGFPKADAPLHAGNAAYHLRTGIHDLTRYDWRCYMDFAEGRGLLD